MVHGTWYHARPNYTRLCHFHTQLLRVKEIVDILSSLKQKGYEINKILDNDTVTYRLSENDNDITVLKNISRLLKKNGGFIFGGAVRDTLVNFEPFNDIDIWFKDIVNRDNFINDLSNDPNLDSLLEDEFSLGKYLASKPRTFEARFKENHYNPVKIDIFVSDELPVDDSYINQLIYDGSIQHISGNPNILDGIIFMIKNKFFIRLPNKKYNTQIVTYNEERQNKFKLSGWTILKPIFIEEGREVQDD